MAVTSKDIEPVRCEGYPRLVCVGATEPKIISSKVVVEKLAVNQVTKNIPHSSWTSKVYFCVQRKEAQ